MDNISRTIIERARPSTGERAHQLYLDFIHLGIALMPGRTYAVRYRVRTRHLWETDGGMGSEGTAATLSEAIAQCATAHRASNRDGNDWQVEWSATLTITRGSWQQTLIVPPNLYQNLIPGGTIYGDIAPPNNLSILHPA